MCSSDLLKHVGGVRRELGFRTVFNLLGPLANPAGVKRQLLGVYDAIWVEPVAHTLAALGSESAWVVHGSDGIDEITLSGPTKVAALENGKIRSFEIAPEDAGLMRQPLSALKGGDPAANAAAMRSLLDGAKGAFRDVVLFNSAAALIVAGRVTDLRAGVARAEEARRKTVTSAGKVYTNDRLRPDPTTRSQPATPPATLSMVALCAISYWLSQRVLQLAGELLQAPSPLSPVAFLNYFAWQKIRVTLISPPPKSRPP